MAKSKRLRLAPDDDSVFGGVCAGVANYFDFDPVLLRVPLFLLVCFYGVGLLIYIAFWVSMPHQENDS